MRRGALAALGILFLGFLVVPAAHGSAFWPFGGSSALPPSGTDLRTLGKDVLARAIRFRTVDPPGNERPLAEFLVAVLRREGIETKLVETPSEGAPKGRAAVWARWPGTAGKPPIVLLSHLDVVPADESEWTVDPFAGVVAGGYVMGRGALDAKGVATVQLLTLVDLARRKEHLDRDVILLATPGEETGGQLGAGWIVRHHPELLHGARYLLTEGGGVLASETGSPDVWGVAVTEKTPCWMQVTTHGLPGHASAEPADAAVPRLVAALDRIRRLHTEVHVVPAAQRMFAALAPLVPERERAGFTDLAKALRTDPVFRERFLDDRARAALVRNTLAITVLRAGSRTNVVPATARAEIDARLLPGDSCREFVSKVREAAADPGVQIEPTLVFPSGASPVHTALFRSIRAVAHELDPHAVVVPRLIAGFTDAHYFRKLGIVAYGFVPRWLTPSETVGIHGPNERISIDNLQRGYKTLVRILETLDEKEENQP